jgi:D-serine deaminase-like pyridoxal phosphate-dependent protein
MAGTRTMAVSTAGVAPMIAATGRNHYSHAELEAKVKRRDFRGLTKHDLPTPNLVLDQQVFERNLKTMADHCKRTGINLRSHVKVHRSAEIGKRQIESGSIGLCCATISECELMMDTGLPGILWTCQPVGPNKFSRITALTKKDPSFMFAVEDPTIVDQLQELAAAEKITFNVVVDHDIGIGRQGVLPGREGLELSQRIMKAKNLHLAGLMGYSGAASHKKGWPARKKVSEEEVGVLMDSVHLCRKAGIPVGIVTGGSTGSYNIDSEAKDGLTELQAGSYACMDSNYHHIGSKDGNEAYDDFGIALTVLTTVISTHYSKKATIDAGNKSMTQPTDMVKGRPDLRVKRAGAEYGKLEWDHADREPKLGDQVELVLSNLDMSVNCFDRMFVCRGDEVVDVYAVLGRQGPSQR